MLFSVGAQAHIPSAFVYFRFSIVLVFCSQLPIQIEAVTMCSNSNISTAPENGAISHNIYIKPYTYQ